MKSYAFDIGNSTKGLIGMTIRVKAETDDEAIGLANEALSSLQYQGGAHNLPSLGIPGVEYCCVFLNDGLELTAADIGDVEEAV